MDHKKSSRAMILRVIDYGEADRLVTFFTEDFGKLKGVAKHAKRSKKRFGGGLEPGTVGVVKYDEKPNMELVMINEFSIDLPAWRAAKSLASIMNMDIALELADKMLPLAQTSRERFELLSRWLEFLGANEPLMSHRHAFYYKWLKACGLAPVFDRCVLCGGTLPNGAAVYHLDSSNGGVVCGNCNPRPRYGIILDVELLKYLQSLANGKMFKAVNNGADEVFEHLVEHAVGGRIRSLDVARQVGL